ncbi:MAG: aryl-sulfate sulfotransferase [Pirellulales bacterium]
MNSGLRILEGRPSNQQAASTGAQHSSETPVIATEQTTSEQTPEQPVEQIEAKLPKKISTIPDSYPPPFLRSPNARRNPIERVPQVCVVDVELSEPALIVLKIDDGSRQWQQKETLPAGVNSMAILGMYANRKHAIEVEAHLTDANNAERVVAAANKLSFTTPPLPDNFPPMEVITTQPDLAEPGVRMFAVNLWEKDVSLIDYGYLIAVDETGQVVWYCQTVDRTADFKLLSNGHILYQHGSYRYLYEIDILGRDIRSWYAARSAEKPNAKSIAVDVDTLHHDTLQLPNGNYLSLATELRKFERYPVDEFKAEITFGPAWAVCDEIVEFKPNTGEIVQRLALTDLLDTNRFGYLCNNRFWKDKYDDFIDSPCRDWSHANAMQLLADGSLLISLRHLDCIIKLNWSTQKIEWIMGDPAGWSAAFSELLLKPMGELSWPYHQHSPHFTADGLLLMFDNGNYRALPGFGQAISAEQNSSRIVAYRVDENNKTVQQVYSYGAAQGDLFYSPFYGEAEVLPKTGNLLVVDGGHIETEDGKPFDMVPGERQWARIFEIDHSSPPKKAFELKLASPLGSEKGWSIYRGNHFASLNAPFVVRAPKPNQIPPVFPRADIVKRNPLERYTPKIVPGK